MLFPAGGLGLSAIPMVIEDSLESGFRAVAEQRRGSLIEIGNVPTKAVGLMEGDLAAFAIGHRLEAFQADGTGSPQHAPISNSFAE